MSKIIISNSSLLWLQDAVASENCDLWKIFFPVSLHICNRLCSWFQSWRAPLSHAGFVDHRWAVKELKSCGAWNAHSLHLCWFGIHRASHFTGGGNSSEALPCTPGALEAISPQSSGRNPLQLNNFLHLVSTPTDTPAPSPPPFLAGISHNLSARLCFFQKRDNNFVRGYNLELNEYHTPKCTFCLTSIFPSNGTIHDVFMFFFPEINI